MSLAQELRSVHTLRLFMPAVVGDKPFTRAEPLWGKRGPYSHPKTIAGMLAWQALWAHAGRLHVEGPVMVEIYVRVKRPKSHLTRSGSVNAEGRKFPVPSGFDLSNVVKLIEDALKLHAFGDDSCVCTLHVRKSWAAQRDAGVEVTISKALADYASV